MLAHPCALLWGVKAPYSLRSTYWRHCAGMTLLKWISLTIRELLSNWSNNSIKLPTLGEADLEFLLLCQEPRWKTHLQKNFVVGLH